MGNGEWGMGNGEWGTGNGERGMGNGEWGMGNVERRWKKEDTLLRKHCCSWRFLSRANWETFVADTKCFWTKSETFLFPRHKICVRNKCCARVQTGKHLCPQQCVRNNVSSFPSTISVRFLSCECWDFFEDDTIISEDSRRRPKYSEVLGRVLTRTRSQSFSLQKSEIARKVLSFIHFTHGFRSLHGSELTYFWKLCRARRQQLTFFNQAWEIRPQTFTKMDQFDGFCPL